MTLSEAAAELESISAKKTTAEDSLRGLKVELEESKSAEIEHRLRLLYNYHFNYQIDDTLAQIYASDIKARISVDHTTVADFRQPPRPTLALADDFSGISLRPKYPYTDQYL